MCVWCCAQDLVHHHKDDRLSPILSPSHPLSKFAQERQRHASQSTIVRIFVSYIQVLALLRNVPIQVPRVLSVYYRINSQATSYPGSLVSLDCSLHLKMLAGLPTALVRVILSALAPFYIYIAVLIGLIAYYVADYLLLKR